MFRFNLLVASGMIGSLLILFTSFTVEAGGIGNSDIDTKAAMLLTLKEKYGLTEEQAITHLAAEENAVAIHDGLKQLLGDAYAGAWFDTDSLQLVVAISDHRLEDWVKVAGARPVITNQSLIDLQVIMGKLDRESSQSQEWRNAVTSWYPDYRENGIVIEVLDGYGAFILDRVKALAIDQSNVRLKASLSRPVVDNEVRGGDIAGNCSIGFTVEGGFVWAGHCGSVNDSILTPSQQLMGIVAGSDWPDYDRGWVSTLSSWDLMPEVNGYIEGIIPVSGSQDPIGGMFVCRYGQASGGPHCGEIQSLDNSVLYQGQNVPTKGLVQVMEVCSMPGDSGGPYLGPSGMGVGIHSGGPSGCGAETSKFFHPLNDTLDHFQLTLLTTHGGSSAPSITGWLCPNWNTSGSGMFFCQVTYDSQGSTQVIWSGPGSGSGGSFFGSCSAFDTVNIQVTVSNQHGSDSRSASFPCPTGPIS